MSCWDVLFNFWKPVLISDVDGDVVLLKEWESFGLMNLSRLYNVKNDHDWINIC